MLKICENCANAIYQHLPYGSTTAVELSDCKVMDEVTEDEYLNEKPCHCFKPNFTLYDCVIETADYKRIEKLEKLTNKDTFYDDVRKLTKNIKSEHSLKRWQLLADLQFDLLSVQE